MKILNREIDFALVKLFMMFFVAGSFCCSSLYAQDLQRFEKCMLEADSKRIEFIEEARKDFEHDIGYCFQYFDQEQIAECYGETLSSFEQMEEQAAIVFKQEKRGCMKLYL